MGVYSSIILEIVFFMVTLGIFGFSRKLHEKKVENKVANVISFDLTIHGFQNNTSIKEANTKTISNYGGNGITTSWKLILKVHPDAIGVYLNLVEIENSDTRVGIIYKMSIIDCQGKEVNTKSDMATFSKEKWNGFDNFICRNYLSVMANQYMTDGDLTIRCEMKFVEGHGDQEHIHRNFRKMQEETNFQGDRADKLEIQLQDSSKNLEKAVQELETAREKINQLQNIQLKFTQTELAELKQKHTAMKKELEMIIVDLTDKLKTASKNFEDKCQELEEQRLKYESMQEEFEQAKIELELVKAVTESLEMEMANSNRDSPSNNESPSNRDSPHINDSPSNNDSPNINDSPNDCPSNIDKPQQDSEQNLEPNEDEDEQDISGIKDWETLDYDYS